MEPVSDLLRKVLRPKKVVSRRVEHYFELVKPKNWSQYQRIGIHVRAGDFRVPLFQNIGFTVPAKIYFERALRRIVREYHKDINLSGIKANQKRKHHLQLFVATDEFRWTNRNINITELLVDLIAEHMWYSSDGTSYTHLDIEFDIVHSVAHDAGFDLTALSMCDVIIMSTGTFGWWASWLSGKKNIYFKSWPKPGKNHIMSQFNRRDYFPPLWIAIDAPYLEFNTTETSMASRLNLYQKFVRSRKRRRLYKSKLSE